MFIFQNLFSAFAHILHLALTLYMYIVIARAVMSWFNPNPYNSFVQFIHRVTEPPLTWIRQFIPTISGLDLSPIILIFGTIFIDRFIVSTLRTLASF